MYFQKYGIDNVRDPVPILPWYQKWCCSKIFNNKQRTSPLSFRWARGNSLIVRVIRIAREFYFCHFAYLPVLKILQWSRLTCVTGESKKSPWASSPATPRASVVPAKTVCVGRWRPQAGGREPRWTAPRHRPWGLFRGRGKADGERPGEDAEPSEGLPVWAAVLIKVFIYVTCF